MRVPAGAVVGGVAVAVFIEQWRIVEIRVGRDGERENSEGDQAAVGRGGCVRCRHVVGVLRGENSAFTGIGR